MIPITNAQYPHPIWASAIATTVYTARATTALAETALNRILRFNSAMCISEIAVIKIATAIVIATGVTSGFRKKRANSDAAAAKPIVKTNPAADVIQNRLLA